jgi:asparagine synthetase B (glutamine-hydrolysing)
VLKELLAKAILADYNKNPKKNVYLQLSGGCDSSALLFSMMNINAFKFKCITYYYNQTKSFLKRIKHMTSERNIELEIITLTTEEVKKNYKELQARGFKGRVLLDCLSGHLTLCKKLSNSFVINGSYADALYGSYFYHFKPGMNKEAFDKKRRELLAKPDADGVESLRKLLLEQNNYLSTPFQHPAVMDFFFSKTLAECGGTKKLLFNSEFCDDLKTCPFKINRKAQQIESGIRDLDKC